MAAPRVERRLAAILAADVVGYSSLMERDEDRTLVRLKAHRQEFIEPLIAEYQGRIVKLMGDGALVEFASVVDAVRCAVLIQQGMVEREAGVPEAERIRFRIGINLGDVIREADGDLYGDGVNVAARLEQLAEPGGVVVSGTAYDQLQGKLDLPLEFAGEQRVKNIERLVRAYRVRLDGVHAASPRLRHRGRTLSAAAAILLALVLVVGAAWWWLRPGEPGLVGRPSVAVLPFDNLGGDEAAAPAIAAPAFLEAQGAGASAIGGRGGTVHEVTTLADSGAGSLRACVTATGARTCVFRVSGTIHLNSGLWIDQPYLTVAGQTAPGGGIQIAAKNTAQAAVMIAAHDVVWRYTRVRHGYNAQGLDRASNIVVFEGGYNVIVDHNSVAWNQDEGIGVWRSTSAAVKDITLSWNLVAEGLNDHSTGWITGAESRALSDGMTDIDLHHNLTMNNNHRNPLLKNRSGRLVNNLWYNHRFYYNQFIGGAQYDVLGNIFKKGPMYGQIYTGGQHEIKVTPNGGANGSPLFYIAGNRGYYQPDPGGDQWVMTAQIDGENGREVGPLSTAYRRTSPLAAVGQPIQTQPVGQLEGVLLPLVGASRRIACDGSWVPNRDSVDARLVSQYVNNTGITVPPRTEADVGGYPVIAGGTACADTDHDGMPDIWEIANGLNTSNAADRNADADGDGFTNLEEFLNGNS